MLKIKKLIPHIVFLKVVHISPFANIKNTIKKTKKLILKKRMQGAQNNIFKETILINYTSIIN